MENNKVKGSNPFRSRISGSCIHMDILKVSVPLVLLLVAQIGFCGDSADSIRGVNKTHNKKTCSPMDGRPGYDELPL